jgi:hypothetical protein
MTRFIEDTREDPMMDGDIKIGEIVTLEDGTIGEVTDLLDFYPGWIQICVDGIYRGICEDEIDVVNPAPYQKGN